MHSLKALQDSFQRHLFSGDNDIIDHIITSKNVSDSQRLATYRNAYYGRLVEALSIDFAAVKAVLDDDSFTRLCHNYIDTHPSNHYSLRYFGQQFPQFISQHRVAGEHVYLAQLASLEWLFVNAFDAADIQPLSPSIIADIPMTAWPNIRISLHPSVHYLDYHWNIVDIWQAVRDHQALPEISALNETGACVIWHQALSTRYRIIDKHEAIALQAVTQGLTFAQLCERLAEASDEDETDFNQLAMLSASLLKTWLVEGMVIGLEVETKSL